MRKYTIDIVQLDNGYTMRTHTDGCDDTAIVIPESDAKRDFGREFLDIVENYMNEAITNHATIIIMLGNYKEECEKILEELCKNESNTTATLEELCKNESNTTATLGERGHILHAVQRAAPRPRGGAGKPTI